MLAINWARKQNKPYLGKAVVNLQSHVFIVLANQMVTIHRRALSAECLLIGCVLELACKFHRMAMEVMDRVVCPNRSLY